MSLLLLAVLALVAFVVVSILWERFPPRMSIRRKLAVAAWEQSTNPNMFGVVTINVEPALKFLDKINSIASTKVTLTALAGKVLGISMAKYPRTNVRLLWGKIIPHQSIDVSFLVAIGTEQAEGSQRHPDLAQVKITRINERSLVDIAKHLGGGAKELRAGKNKEFNKAKDTIQSIPTWILKYIVSIAGWAASCLGVSFPSLGVSSFPFGSCIITSLGSFGIEEAFVPPTPFANVPLYMCLCSAKKVPAVVDDKIVVQNQMKVTGTVDHRVIDGAEVALLNKYFKTVFEDPETYFKVEFEVKDELILSGNNKSN